MLWQNPQRLEEISMFWSHMLHKKVHTGIQMRPTMVTHQRCKVTMDSEFWYISLYLFISLSASLSVYLPVSLSACLSACVRKALHKHPTKVHSSTHQLKESSHSFMTKHSLAHRSGKEDPPWPSLHRADRTLALPWGGLGSRQIVLVVDDLCLHHSLLLFHLRLGQLDAQDVCCYTLEAQVHLQKRRTSQHGVSSFNDAWFIFLVVFLSLTNEIIHVLILLFLFDNNNSLIFSYKQRWLAGQY